MKIPYRRVSEYVSVDIAQLRPGESYKSLIQKRTYAIDRLVAEHGRIPPDLLTPRVCPTCGGSAWHDELTKDYMALVRCASCNLVFVNPTFDQAHYQAVYQSEDYQVIMRDLGEQSHVYRVERFGEERVALMAAHIPQRQGQAPRYLDVGCSTGFVVEAAARQGWHSVGIDLNPSAAAFGRARGLDLRVATLEDISRSTDTYDAVSLFDVLEHLPTPRATLEAAAHLLVPGGIILLYVPNWDSASRLLMGPHAHFIWPSHHLNYYTPITLSDLVLRCGLEVVTLTTEGLDFADYLWYKREVEGADMGALEPIADTLQFLANAGGYGKNLRLIARRPA